jgi:hypothetical protein
MQSKRPWSAAQLLAWIAVGLPACQNQPFDTTRRIAARGTLGEEVFKLIDKDMERDTPDRAQGFELEKDGFVSAIDHLFPAAELSRDQQFLLNLLPLYDDGSIPDLTRTTAAIGQRLEADTNALAALAAVENRAGYIDLRHEEALVRRIASYPRYRQLSDALINLALAHDGLDDQGNPLSSEDDSFTRLVRGLASGMQTLTLSQDTERTIVGTADLMLTEDARLDSTLTSSGPMQLNAVPAMVVARDVRGMAQVDSSGGSIPPPFADMDHDGLADVDSAGRFVDQSGQPIDLAPFGTSGVRDTEARAIAAPGGAPLYQYVRLERTVASGLLRDTKKIISDGLPMRVVHTFDTILGPRGQDGTYVAVQNAVVDVAHALGATINLQEVPDLLQLIGAMLNQHEPTLAYLSEETDKQFTITDRYNVALKPGSTFYDDLMSTLRKILNEPGLAEDLIDKIQNDPAILGFPTADSTTMEHKKDPITQADFDGGTVFDTPVDRTQGDVKGNQSIHQRVLHLIYDTKGARYEPHLLGVPLGFIFSIDDLGVFFMRSIIGRSTVPSLVATLTGLSTTPTPQELASFINTDQTFGNPVGNEGIPVKDNDGDTLYAVNASGMTDALKPIVQVFDDHNRLDLLFELFKVLHLHWATSASDYQGADATMPRYSLLSGISAYEPLLIDTFRNAQLLAATSHLLNDTASIQTQGGKAPRDLLLAFVRRLVAIDPNLLTHDGAREVMVFGQRVTPLSPLDLMRGARSSIRTIVARTPSLQTDWTSIVQELHDLFLQTSLTGQTTAQFTNPRVVPVGSALLGFLEKRARKHTNSGDLGLWAQQDIPNTAVDFVTSKALPPAIDLIYAIDADPNLEGMLIELRDQLLDENQGFGELLATVGDTLGASKDASVTLPFLHFLGQEIDPDKKLLFKLLKHAKQSIAADPDELMLEIARRGLEDAPGGGLFLYGFGRSIRQSNRTRPTFEGPLDGGDIQKIVHIVSSYMLDDQHGLEKFYQLVEDRK